MIAWTPQIQYDQHDYHICYNHHLNHNLCQDPYMIYYHSHNQFQNHDQGHCHSHDHINGCEIFIE